MGISHKTTTMLAAVVLFLSVTASSSNDHGNHDLVDDLEDLGYIVGGNRTTIEKVPWQASLTEYGKHFCGGAIVSERIIVTAAQCISKPFQTIQVRTGSSRLNKGGVLTDVLKTIAHKRSSHIGYDYDIGIVMLSENLQFGLATKPISLAKQDEPLVEGELIQVTGWGELIEGGASAEFLQEIYVPIYNQESCSRILHFMESVTDRMFCGGYPEGGKDACNGDTGGPAVMNGTLVGIISWGHGCGQPAFPRVFTNIAALRDWLDLNALL